MDEQIEKFEREDIPCEHAVVIDRAENGFKLTVPNPNTGEPMELVYSYDYYHDDGEGESMAVRDALNAALEELLPYSKHKKWNVVAVREKDGEIIRSWEE